MPEAKKCPQCGAPLSAGTLEGLCPACLLKQGAADTGTQPQTVPFEPPTAEDVARLFPQLEIFAFIGKGGMGAVYKARQPVLDRIVALKILPPQTGNGPDFAERFNREARALAKLSHPNIVAIHEFGQVDHLPYFIMEFVDGLNLRQLERLSRLTSGEALKIIPQICEALQFAHDEGIVHRDIKPENILLDKKGRVKIADFGIAKVMGQEADVAITETKHAMGTPHYMAPEQMENPQTVDHRADIFSLGVVFYEMLTGELPLGKFAPPSRKVQVDVRLDEVVLRALEKEPELRYQHASHVKTAVDTIVATPSSGGTSRFPQSSGPIARQKQDRFWRWFAVTVLALIVIPVAIAVLAVMAGIAIPAFMKVKERTHQKSAVEINLKEGAQNRLAGQQMVDALPPVVVRTVPASGALDVAPGIVEISATFSKEMAGESWSWSTAWADSAPESVGDPRYDPNQRTCTMKVKLEPGKTYAWWLNSGQFQNFRDTTGKPAVPYLLIFQTSGKERTP